MYMFHRKEEVHTIVSLALFDLGSWRKLDRLLETVMVLR